MKKKSNIDRFLVKEEEIEFFPSPKSVIEQNKKLNKKLKKLLEKEPPKIIK